MFNAKTIILAKALRPDLNFASPGAEELIWLKIASRYASGNPVRNATISNGIAYFDGVSVSQPLVSLKLNIPVTQTGNGTPSPTNIRDFVGVSQAVISRTGKNLLDARNSEIALNINMWFYGDPNVYKYWKAGTYLFSAEYNTINNKVYYSIQGTSITRVIAEPTETGMFYNSFTLPYDGYYRFFAQNGDGISASDITNVMIQIGDTATAYEPYTGNTYPISFGQTVYSAILDVLTGKLYFTHEIKTIDENSNVQIAENGILLVNSFFEISEDTDSANCNVYQRGENRGTVVQVSAYNPDLSFCCKLGTNTTRIMIKDTRFTSTDDYKTWLSTNPVKIAIKLATPIEVQLTPTQITTLIGENVIFADVADVTECKYTRK